LEKKASIYKDNFFISTKELEIPDNQNGIVIRNGKIVFADALHYQVTQAIVELRLEPKDYI
jgi:hypothetical protein